MNLDVIHHTGQPRLELSAEGRSRALAVIMTDVGFTSIKQSHGFDPYRIEEIHLSDWHYNRLVTLLTSDPREIEKSARNLMAQRQRVRDMLATVEAEKYSRVGVRLEAFKLLQEASAELAKAADNFLIQRLHTSDSAPQT